MATQGPDKAYEQQLHRAIGVIGNLAITLSAITPAASVFIIAPIAYQNQGSGAFLSFVIAAIIGLGMAACYGELGSSMPVVGGQYSLVARVLGRPLGFLAFVIYIALALVIPSAIALGAGQYLSVLVPNMNSNLVGAAIMVLTTLLAILSIRFNAIVTGIFLLIELAAVAVVTILGLVNVHQPLSILFNPQTFAPDGTTTAVGLGVILAGVAIGIFSYNGYDNPIIFAEETVGHRRGIAVAVFSALIITVAAELIPVTAGLLGAPSLAELSKSSTPMSYLVKSLGGDTLDTFVSLGIFIAIFNATLAIILGFARIIYSSGRDKAWPEPFSSWLATIHPTYRSPWVATAVVGVVGAVLTALSSVAALVTFTGVLLLVLYALVAISAIVSRFNQREMDRPWRMPLWPLPPLVALVGCVVAFTQQSQSDLLIAGGILLVGAVYYFAYLHRKPGVRWVMLDPIVHADHR